MVTGTPVISTRTPGMPMPLALLVAVPVMLLRGRGVRRNSKSTHDSGFTVMSVTVWGV